ncbi:MAG: hypothetical protein JWO36_4361 [Myxococcales bacterium]|nr:hypothetical protein [Myxococcales bacterium]
MNKKPSQTPATDPSVVEIDAMDVNEWEHGQHTPKANETKLGELVRQSAPSTPPESQPSAPRKTATFQRLTTSSGPTTNTIRKATAAEQAAPPPVKAPEVAAPRPDAPKPSTRPTRSATPLAGSRSVVPVAKKPVGEAPAPSPKPTATVPAVPPVKQTSTLPAVKAPTASALPAVKSPPQATPAASPPPQPRPAAPAKLSPSAFQPPQQPQTTPEPFSSLSQSLFDDETVGPQSAVNEKPTAKTAASVFQTQPPANPKAANVPAHPPAHETPAAKTPPSAFPTQAFANAKPAANVQAQPSAHETPTAKTAASLFQASANETPIAKPFQTQLGHAAIDAANGAPRPGPITALPYQETEPARVVQAPAPAVVQAPVAAVAQPPSAVYPPVQYPTVGDGWIDHGNVAERARQDSLDDEDIKPNKSSRARRDPTGSTRPSAFVVASKVIAKASRSRPVQIGAGAFVLVVVIIVLATSGKHEEAASTPPPVAIVQPQPPEPPPAVAVAPQPIAGDPPRPTKPIAIAPAVAPAKPAPRKLGGKAVVLEYDSPKHEVAQSAPAAVIPKADEPALERARTAYATGNQRLFAGDADGAIRAYQQALGIYPGYVAGYRGLGLAYAQQGDNAKALQALRTYVTSVPKARDVALLKKRIARLQAH